MKVVVTFFVINKIYRRCTKGVVLLGHHVPNAWVDSEWVSFCVEDEIVKVDQVGIREYEI